MKKIVITQSNYIPWKGYFDAIALADDFVIYDDMQYTKRDWRNRNVIKTAQGLKWLSIPVEVKGKFSQKINETKISDPNWNRDHWNQLRENYKTAPYFKAYSDFFEDLYRNCNSVYLTEINVRFLDAISGLLDIKPNFLLSSDFELVGDRTEKLANLTEALGGTDYYSGAAAKNYMDESVFTDKGIAVNYFDYSNYPEYDQMHPPFEHGVSVIDLIFNTGDDAKTFLKNKR